MMRLLPVLLTLLLAASAAQGDPAGTACTSSSTCDAGLLCLDAACRQPRLGDRCDDVARCPEGTKCQRETFSSTCIPDRKAGEECTRFTNECPRELTCELKSDADPVFICKPRGIRAGNACPDDNRECGEKSQCLEREGQQVCVSQLSEGDACDSSQPFNPCTATEGLVCKGNSCVKAEAAEGQPCDNTSGPFCPAGGSFFFRGLVCEDAFGTGTPRCTAKRALGEKCGADINSSCISTLSCIQGRCAEPNGGRGSTCTADNPDSSQCRSDLFCAAETGRCSGTGKVDRRCGQPNGPVTIVGFNVCAEGLFCNESGENAQCSAVTPTPAPKLPPGSECTVPRNDRDPRPCQDGYECYSPSGIQFAGTCVKTTGLGGSCNDASFLWCKGEGAERLKCDEGSGKCVPSNIGRLGDKCGDKADGSGPTGVECFGGDECGDFLLTCFDRGGGGLDPRVGDNLFCGLENQKPGEPCSTGAKGLSVLAKCAGEATCFSEGLSAGGTCLLTVGEGDACDYEGFIRCESGLTCAAGVCVKA